jgi:hypothetical protein
MIAEIRERVNSAEHLAIKESSDVASLNGEGPCHPVFCYRLGVDGFACSRVPSKLDDDESRDGVL